MKKMFLFCCILAFTACFKKELSQDLVQKYETQINQNFKKALKENDFSDLLTFEFNDFSCKAQERFIECFSPDFKVFKASHLKEQILEFSGIEYLSNEVYLGEDKGLISLDEYYKELFKDKNQVMTKIKFKDIKLSKNLLKEYEEDLALIGDQKIANFLSSLAKDVYDFSFEFQATKDLGYNFFYDLKGNDQPTQFFGRLDVKMLENFLKDFSNELDLKFDTQKLNFNKPEFNAFNMLSVENLPHSLKNVFFDSKAKIGLIIDPKDAFEQYLNLADAYLNLAKNQSQKAEQVLMIDKLLSLLEDFKIKPYKLDLDFIFKRMNLKKFEENQGFSLVESFNINGRDFTGFFDDFDDQKALLGTF